MQKQSTQKLAIKQKSALQTRSKEPPKINHKLVPLHFCCSSNQVIKEVSDAHQPFQFWGCVRPPSKRSMDKTMYRTINKFKPHEDRKPTDSKEKSSELILLKYLKRKQRKMNRNRQSSPFPDTFYSAQSPPKLRKNSKQKLHFSQTKQKNMLITYQSQQQTTEITEDINQPWEDNSRLRRKNEKAQKFMELHALIKWRAKLAEEIQQASRRIQKMDSPY